MFQRSKLDARRVDPKTKKAVLLDEFLSDDERDKLPGVKKPPEVPGLDLPKEDQLTPVRPLPGAPKGQRGEVEEPYIPMSAAELEVKRKEQETAPPSAEEGPPAESFRNVMQRLLKKDTPEGKKEDAQLAKYGPPEDIKGVIDTLTPYQRKIEDVDEATAKAIIERSSLPDILKERANQLFESRSPNDGVKAEQLALNLMKAKKRPEVEAAIEWLHDEPGGQEFLQQVFEMVRTRKVMQMLSNTMLAMEGEAVIDQPKGEPRSSPEQRAEKKRLQGLMELLDTKRIDQAEFDNAKRQGWTADDTITNRLKPPTENIQQRVERKYREDEAKRRKGSYLNMRKVAEGDTTGPGGPNWEYEWTSGPSPTKEGPQKRKQRFPFHNKPSGRTPGEGDQGNLHDVGPLGGQSDMNYLANAIESMRKTADNDMFSIYSFSDAGSGGKWLTYTIFKEAYSKFRPGDIVVQSGQTAADWQTYRRRFGSVKKAQKSLFSALYPILATVVGQPTPDDSLHDLQKGAPPGGTYGPHTSPYDKQPEQGNRDGYDAKNTPRPHTKRKFIPYMDTPDDEGHRSCIWTGWT